MFLNPSEPAHLADLKDRAAERQILSIYDDRIQTEQQLMRVYERWAAQLERQHGIVLHLMLQSVAIILLILICMILGAAMVHHFMSAWPPVKDGCVRLRSVLELSIQVIGGLLILLVIFGWPQQMPTILGLVTAGITIVLQDFILAFFGWFVLMGKNGMRVGDRVEINGVGGEVTEIGLINTTLLEIGSHADTGLPTGRRISFINSFAIRGQYFNYSTAGQWLWDEITINLARLGQSAPDRRSSTKTAFRKRRGKTQPSLCRNGSARCTAVISAVLIPRQSSTSSLPRPDMTSKSDMFHEPQHVLTHVSRSTAACLIPFRKLDSLIRRRSSPITQKVSAAKLAAPREKQG